MTRVLAVVVLYGMTWETSPSCRTLFEALKDWELASGLIDVLLVDNSATACAPPAEVACRYVWDGSNPGLARRYNEALAEALRTGARWLLLLDQDTTLSAAYVEEMLRLTEELAGREDVVAIAPRLLEGGRLQSPHAPQYRPAIALRDESHGLQEELLRVYNSGAALRVAAVKRAGGFPEAYWLDYLDHAVFHRLQAAGGRVWLMRARLEHEMSVHRADKQQDPAHAARHRNQLAAEARFYREFGTVLERRRNRRDLLRRAAGAWRRGRFAEAWRVLRALL